MRSVWGMSALMLIGIAQAEAEAPGAMQMMTELCITTENEQIKQATCLEEQGAALLRMVEVLEGGDPPSKMTVAMCHTRYDALPGPTDYVKIMDCAQNGERNIPAMRQ